MNAGYEGIVFELVEVALSCGIVASGAGWGLCIQHSLVPSCARSSFGVGSHNGICVARDV